MNQETPLFAKAYDLLLYLLQISETFPRSHRDLSRRLREVGFRFLDFLLAARKSPPDQRQGLLRQADIELDRLRYTVRVCHGLNLISQKQYLYAAGLLAETGKLLGTWIKPPAS